MPIPSSFTDLDTNPNNNSPQGPENVGPNANGYIQALGAFIKQIYNGSLKPAAAVDLNAQKLTNLANGAVSTTSKDAVTGAQLQAVYKVGEVKMWHGAVANISTTWGNGWQLADGTNGTADLRSRFVVGAGTTYAPNDVGGNSSNTLTISQLPSHNHGVNDPGHGHVVSDPGHGHGITDPGHIHGLNGALSFGAGGNNVSGGGVPFGPVNSNNSTTGISINGALTGVSVVANGTGISTQNTGSGASIENRPPYYALCFIEYTGIGA